MKTKTYYCAAALILYAALAQCNQTKEPTLFQSVVIGSMCGATEVGTTGQPLFYMTNMKVSKERLSKNPLQWYRGVGVNMGFMIPITAIQKTVVDQGEQWLQHHQGHKVSSSQKVGIAFCGGLASALASTPGESIPTYLQQPQAKGVSTWEAIKTLKGNVYRGVTHTMLRDGMFTVGYSALAPIFTNQFAKITNKAPGTDLAGGITAGVLTAIVTQPSTVIKTKLQTDSGRQLYKNSWQAIQQTYHTEGIKGFFVGLSARGMRVTCAIPILCGADQLYKKWLLEPNVAQ